MIGDAAGRGDELEQLGTRRGLVGHTRIRPARADGRKNGSRLVRGAGLAHDSGLKSSAIEFMQ